MLFEYPLPYSKTSTALFAHIRHWPDAVLLQSPSKSNGRYDIFSAHPRMMATLQSNGLVIESTDSINTTSLDAIDFLLTQLPKTLPKSTYPFMGGLIGYGSYDWGLYLQKVPRQLNPHHPLPLLKVGLYDWAIVIDHQEKVATYVSYNGNDHPLHEIETLLNTFSQEKDDFALYSSWHSSIDYHTYQQKFSHIQQHLHAGDCYQVNFSQRFFSQYQGDPWYAYQRLIGNCSSSFCAYLNYSDHQILSISPERFIQVKQQQVITQPIKGTSARSQVKSEDQQLALALQNSEKDRAENVMIVDMLRNDLGRLCLPGSIQVPALCELQSYHTVHHLVSTIIGTLPQTIHPLHLFKSIFPGASITGAPKKRVMEIIEALETHQRHIYCGSIFYYSVDDQFDSNIAICTALCYDGVIEIAGGGGIVLDSKVDAEYEEIQNKIGKMLEVLRA